MRVLVLSPGTLEQQMVRLPAIAAAAEQLQAAVQVACPLASRPAWDLIPAVEKVISFDFEDRSTLADWANLLGCVREPDFQVCLNFATGRQVNLMLSMSHIPTRIAKEGFSTTDTVQPSSGWRAQGLGAFLQPIGVTLCADDFRLSLPAQDLSEARSLQPSGEGPLLLMAPGGQPTDWPVSQWKALPASIRERLASLRTHQLPTGGALRSRAAQVACSDVVLSSCPITQMLAVYLGIPLVALGAEPAGLPSREGLRCLDGQQGDIRQLQTQDVLGALGF